MSTITIPGVPVAQPRQRHRVMQVNGHTLASNYTPAQHPVQQRKAAVAFAWRAHTDGPPLEGPVRLWVEFYLPRPQRLRTKTWLGRRVLHSSKPDIDNLIKSLKDALTGLAWRDDSQVAQVHASKEYARADEQPRAVIEVEPIKEGQHG